jgi:hypothetical protein
VIASPRPRSAPALLLLALALLGPASSPRAAGAHPADDLLALVPPDAGVTIVVEDLRTHAPAVLASPLVRGLARWPAVVAWMNSEPGGRLLRARGDVEAMLGLPLTRLRDDVLGDAVVLALVLPAGAPPEAARGLLLTRVRDRAALDRVLTALNAGESRAGTLRQVDARVHGGSAYSVRVFERGANKPDEAYAVLEGGVFAWSNSIELVTGVIDRRAGASDGGLRAEPRAVRMAAAQPADCLARVLVDPRYLERAAAQPPEKDDPGQAWLRRYVGALEYLGLALSWRDGPVVELVEHRAPERLDEPLRRWAARPGGLEPLLRRVPADAPVVVATHLDATALIDLLLGLVPPAERPRADAVLQTMRGLFLGRDLRAEVAPALGPAAVGYLDVPPAGHDDTVHAALAIALADGSDARPAIENGLRTLFALSSLGDQGAKNRPARAVETREIGGTRVTVLAGGGMAPAFALAPGAVAIGLDPEAVAALASGETPGGPPWLAPLRADRFPGAETFLAADLAALAGRADARREALVARLSRDRAGDRDAAARDLDLVLGLLHRFRAGYLASTTTPDGAEARRVAGLIAAPAPAADGR